MPYTMSWAVPHRVVHQHVYGILTMTQLAQANAEIMHYLADGQGKLLVHQILHFKDYEGSELDVFKISHTSSVLRYVRHPALGWVCMMGLNPTLNRIGGLFYGIARTRFKAFDTYGLEQVASFLRLRDSTVAEVEFDWSGNQKIIAASNTDSSDAH